MMQEHTMDLITDPWIPILGGPPVGLAQALVDAHHIDLAASGPERTALLRVLTVLAARVSGLDAHTDRIAWAEHRARLLDQGRFDQTRVRAYLDAHTGRFDLFDPVRPWMQDPRLAAECPKRSGVWKLAWGRGSQERPALFHWGPVDLPVPTTQAVLDLLTQYMFGSGGRVSARDHGGTRAAYVGMGPLRGSVSYHPATGDLFTDLVLGMPYVPRTGTDPAPWERDLNDPLAPAPEPTGLATLVLGRFRHALLLVPSPDHAEVVDAYVTWGAQAPTRPVRDPWQVELAKRDGGTYVPLADAERSPWRDLPLLLDPATAPAVWDRLAKDACGPLDLPDGVGVAVCGFAQDRGQTRDHATINAHIPGVGRALNDTGQRQQRLDRIAELEEAAVALGKACTAAAKVMGMKTLSGRAGLLSDYWWQADQPRSEEAPAKQLALQVWDRARQYTGRRGSEAAAAGRLVLEDLPDPTPTGQAVPVEAEGREVAWI